MTNGKNIVDKDSVKKIAKLCNLLLADSECESYADDISKTIEYIQILNELDTKDVKATSHVGALANVFMKDGNNKATLSVNEALKNASNKEDDLFFTKGVIEK